jgi:transcriptional regulator with XRE-family HTH domain
MEDIKGTVAKNIAELRLLHNMTQMDLAEKLNYSDKAVSKWERGESMPDVTTLVQLAEQFDITVNDLVVDPDALPGNPGTLEKAMTQVSEKALKRKADKGIILGLSSILVWFVALLLYVLLSSFDIGERWNWIFFFYAIPANCIVLLSLRSAWHDFRWNKMLISGIMWGSLLSIYVTATFWNFYLWRIFLLGILGQAAIFLWFRMFRTPKESVREETENG